MQDKKCTLFPDGDWTPCCIQHDKEYALGGTLADKKEADLRLLACFLRHGRAWNALGVFIYIGVRLGGKIPFGLHFGRNFK